MAGSRAVGSAVAGVCVAVLVAGCSAATATTTAARSTDGGINTVGATVFKAAERSRALRLSGRTLAGGVLDLGSLRGHVVVLNVWASWCAPCKAESPALLRVEHAVSSDGVDFVGIDENDEGSSASAFLTSIGSDYPNLVDPEGRLLALLTMLPPAVPSSLVLDKEGRVAARVVGPTTEAQMTSLVQQVLAGG